MAGCLTPAIQELFGAFARFGAGAIALFLRLRRKKGA